MKFSGNLLGFRRSMPIIENPEFEGAHGLSRGLEQREHEFFSEMIRIGLVGGMIEGFNNFHVPSDGSKTVFNPALNGEDLTLADFSALQSTSPVSLERFIYLAKSFLNGNPWIMEVEKLPWGITRLESLFSADFASMGARSFFQWLEASMAERRDIFREKFPDTFKSSPITIDDDPNRNVFRVVGEYRWKLGDIELRNGEKKSVWLVIRPGHGETDLGTDFGVTLDAPQSSLFTVGVNMKHWRGAWHPCIEKIHLSPLQLDEGFNYVSCFMDMTDFHSRLIGKSRLVGSQEIMRLLGGVEKENSLLNLLLSVVCFFYRQRGFDWILGIPWQKNLWLRYHNPEMRAKSIKKIGETGYNCRFSRVGFSWDATNNLYVLSLPGAFPNLIRLLAGPVHVRNRQEGKECLPVFERLISKECFCTLSGAMQKFFPEFDFGLSRELRGAFHQAKIAWDSCQKFS